MVGSLALRIAASWLEAVASIGRWRGIDAGGAIKCLLSVCAFLALGAFSARAQGSDVGRDTLVVGMSRFPPDMHPYAEAEALARPEAFDAYQNLGKHCTGIRRWSSDFLVAFKFESVLVTASLMRAIEMLREADRSATSTLPEPAPTGFVRRL